MSNELSVQTIKEEAERTRESLEIRQGKQPPMSQRLTMSISALLNNCNRTLFLCNRIYQHEGIEGGISASCGHPIQCLYAAAKIDGGPVCCSMCDQNRRIEKLNEELAISKENQKALLEQVDSLTNQNRELKETNQVLANGLEDIKESLE